MEHHMYKSMSAIIKLELNCFSLKIQRSIVVVMFCWRINFIDSTQHDTLDKMYLARRKHSTVKAVSTSRRHCSTCCEQQVCVKSTTTQAYRPIVEFLWHAARTCAELSPSASSSRSLRLSSWRLTSDSSFSACCIRIINRILNTKNFNKLSKKNSPETKWIA